jgi:hypothetical protein
LVRLLRTYTDEDIDRILQRGEKRTEELNRKYADNVNSLWKMFSTEGKSVYQWEGKDWSLEAQKKLARKILVMPKRERKRAYSPSHSFSSSFLFDFILNTNIFCVGFQII